MVNRRYPYAMLLYFVFSPIDDAGYSMIGGLFFLIIGVVIIEIILLVKIAISYKKEDPKATIKASVMGGIVCLIFILLKIRRSVVLISISPSHINFDVSILQKLIGFSYLVAGLVYFVMRTVYLAKNKAVSTERVSGE